MEKRDSGFAEYLRKIKFIAIILVSITAVIGMSRPKEPYLFPPAGSLSEFVFPFSFLMVCTCLVLPWFVGSARNVKRMVLFAGVFLFILLFTYPLLIFSFVVPINIPAKREIENVIVGYQRTPGAEEHYSNLTNAEMLKQGGFDEAALDELFTRNSRLIVIWLIFFTYVGLPSTFAIVIGSASRYDQLQF